jgi:predicted site-specific integrase-resolvase
MIRGLLTVDEVAVACQVTTRTVRRWMAAGALVAHSTMDGRPLFLAMDVVEIASHRSCQTPVS